MSKELGTALDWQGLMKIAETKAVRYLKVMTCNNIDSPLGMGLWEGVPLRDVIWLARPRETPRSRQRQCMESSGRPAPATGPGYSDA